MGFLEETTLALEERSGRAGLAFNLIASLEGISYTERLRSSLIALISIFLRPMVDLSPYR